MHQSATPFIYEQQCYESALLQTTHQLPQGSLPGPRSKCKMNPYFRPRSSSSSGLKSQNGSSAPTVGSGKGRWSSVEQIADISTPVAGTGVISIRRLHSARELTTTTLSTPPVHASSSSYFQHNHPHPHPLSSCSPCSPSRRVLPDTSTLHARAAMARTRRASPATMTKAMTTNTHLNAYASQVRAAAAITPGLMVTHARLHNNTSMAVGSDASVSCNSSNYPVVVAQCEDAQLRRGSSMRDRYKARLYVTQAQQRLQQQQQQQQQVDALALNNDSGGTGASALRTRLETRALMNEGYNNNTQSSDNPFSSPPHHLHLRQHRLSSASSISSPSISLPSPPPPLSMSSSFSNSIRPHNLSPGDSLALLAYPPLLRPSMKLYEVLHGVRGCHPAQVHTSLVHGSTTSSSSSTSTSVSTPSSSSAQRQTSLRDRSSSSTITPVAGFSRKVAGSGRGNGSANVDTDRSYEDGGHADNDSASNGLQDLGWSQTASSSSSSMSTTAASLLSSSSSIAQRLRRLGYEEEKSLDITTKDGLAEVLGRRQKAAVVSRQLRDIQLRRLYKIEAAFDADHEAFMRDTNDETMRQKVLQREQQQEQAPQHSGDDTEYDDGDGNGNRDDGRDVDG